MKISKHAVLAAGIVLAALLGTFRPATADENQPSGYDLAAAVNAYRAANGYYALNPHALVAAAAQAHADWIVETGQGGHIGASGSDETVRVSWTGYGDGSSIQCDENWAGGTNITDVVYGSWSDWTHQEVMLNAWGNRYTDIGGGVATYGDGRYVFVLNVCLVVGHPSSGDIPDIDPSPPTTNSTGSAADELSNYIYGVTRAAPQADGSIRHIVLYGQTLASIAEAYGVTIDTLRSLNDIAADSTIIWPDDELLIHPPGTVPTYTQEAMPVETEATSTPSATPTNQVQPPQPSPTGTETPQAVTDEGQPLPLAGIAVLGMAGIGLVMSLYFTLLKK